MKKVIKVDPVTLAVMIGAGVMVAVRVADRDVLARTIWAEARGEGPVGMGAVANVIMNRVRDPRWPNTVRGVCKQANQFTAWNPIDPNGKLAREANSMTPWFPQALTIAGMALAGTLADYTNGANHYYNPSVVTPEWAARMAYVGDIGNHRFMVG